MLGSAMIRVFPTSDPLRPVAIAGFGPGTQPWTARRWCEWLTPDEVSALWAQLGELREHMTRPPDPPEGAT